MKVRDVNVSTPGVGEDDEPFHLKGIQPIDEPLFEQRLHGFKD
jgi:hypothetical protein